MSAGQRPEAIDSRLVFRVYRWVAAAGGVSAFVVALLLVQTGGALSVGLAATLGMAGAVSWAFASQAAAFADVIDPVDRLRGLKLFALAHLMVGGFLWALNELARTALWLPGAAGWTPYRLLASSLLVGGVVLLYLAYTASPGPRFMATVRTTATAADGRAGTFARREKERFASMRRLRLHYEEQIRQAARQEERARLARDLHDAVKQQLFVIQTAAATIQARFETDPGGARAGIDQVRTAAREAITEMDAMLGELQASPIENVGLIEALKTQCDAVGFRTGAAVTLDVQPLPPAHLLPPGAQQAIFRVAQEALANIARHARARQATVRLGVRRRNLVLEIVDDGGGFDPMAHGTGMGIGNMQSRAADLSGRFELASSPGAGTTVVFSVPFAAHSPERYLLLSAAFASALVVCAGLLARGDAGLRAWWIAGVYIAAIGAARYLVAFFRVRRRKPEAP